MKNRLSRLARSAPEELIGDNEKQVTFSKQNKCAIINRKETSFNHRTLTNWNYLQSKHGQALSKITANSANSANRSGNPFRTGSEQVEIPCGLLAGLNEFGNSGYEFFSLEIVKH